MAHPHARYWNAGRRNVPRQTGAAALMDGNDLLSICAALGVPTPLDSVLDVGCGTGRVAKHCGDYLGLDIAQDAVDYCRAAGIMAIPIDGPDDLKGECIGDGYDVALAMSVFTHIDMAERTAYLLALRPLARMAIIDIIPGDGHGEVALWTCPPDDFTDAAIGAGWTIVSVHDRRSPEGVPHRYYRLE